MENKFLQKYNLFISTVKKNWFDKFSILNLLPYQLFLKDYFVFPILLCGTYSSFKKFLFMLIQIIWYITKKQRIHTAAKYPSTTLKETGICIDQLVDLWPFIKYDWEF